VTSRVLSVPLPDGRKLEAVAEGDEGGTLLIFHHGSPGAAVSYAPFDRAAAERGIRLVTMSRAGFGGSSRQPGRSVASAAADAAELADHLGADRFLTAGWSGGGPHALACAALLPERVSAAATIAGVAPYVADDLDWAAGMGEENRIEYGIAARDPDELLRWHAAAGRDLEDGPAERDRRRPAKPRLRSRRGVAERAGRGAARRVLPSRVRGGSVGLVRRRPRVHPAVGVRDRVHPVPLSIWQGRHDLMVPFTHGEWLVEHVAGARSRLRPEHGHLSLAVGSIGEIFEDLLEAAAPVKP
jgi:pimeloyl-ACP methyl ester carboxylesterase